jgi:hypothetical protein
MMKKLKIILGLILAILIALSILAIKEKLGLKSETRKTSGEKIEKVGDSIKISY